MLFLSNILGSIVRDIADEEFGKLKDIVVKMEKKTSFPPVVGIIVEAKKNKREEYFILFDDVETWGKKEISLRKKIQDFFPGVLPFKKKDCVFLRKNILDKQIVDLQGMRVVRVNDLQLGQIRNVLSLVAIDISNRGLIRRMSLTGLRFFDFLKPNLIEWKDIGLVHDKLHLAKGIKDLVRLHPADIANIIEKMRVTQGSILLQSLDQETAAHVLEEIQPGIKKILVKNLGAERTAAIMNKMSVDDLVDLIQLLPSIESKELINSLPVNKKTQKVKKILEYDEDKAGGLMTTEFISAYPDTNVGEVIEEIRKVSSSYRSIHFVYVINKENKFLGVVSLRRLIISDKNKLMRYLMKKTNRIPVVHVKQNLISIAINMTKYNLLSVAVVDKEKKLLGIVTVDDVMRRLIPNA